MKRVPWDDPRVLRIGKKYADEAYDLAANFNWYGADATAFLMTDDEQNQRSKRLDDQVCVPVMFADAVMAVLLSLPRKGNKRGRRRVWSIDEALARVNKGESKRKVAREFSEEVGLPTESIRRQLRGKQAKKKAKKTPGAIKRKSPMG